VIASSLLDLVGSTPLVRLGRLSPREDVRLLAKLEMANPGGSAKDRSAEAMLSAALANGDIEPGGTIIESSSGNLAMALARMCVLHDLHFECVVDPKASPATLGLVEALGGRVHRVDEPDPDTGDYLIARVQRVQELLAERPGALNLDQYSNPAPVRAHADGTMAEICAEVVPDVVLVATSTTGTIGGCLTWVREHDLPTLVMAVDLEGSVLFGGARGERRIGGFGAGLVPALSEGVEPHRVVRVSDVDCVAGARLLTRTEGIVPGGSGGGVVAATMRLLPELPADAVAVLVLHDGGLAYADTVYSDEWVTDQLGVDAERLESWLR